MTTTPHEVRNWLHQLLSSIEAAMPEVTAHCFSREQPLDIQVPIASGAITSWDALAETVGKYLGDLRPGSLRYRLTEMITLGDDTLSPEIALPASFRWKLSVYRRGESGLYPLECGATLIREGTELVAVRLTAVPPPLELPAEAASAPDQNG